VTPHSLRPPGALPSLHFPFCATTQRAFLSSPGLRRSVVLQSRSPLPLHLTSIFRDPAARCQLLTSFFLDLRASSAFSRPLFPNLTTKNAPGAPPAFSRLGSVTWHYLRQVSIPLPPMRKCPIPHAFVPSLYRTQLVRSNRPLLSSEFFSPSFRRPPPLEQV